MFRILPKFSLLMCQILHPRELTREHKRLAEIIEMIHTASLIHDDVLDDSDMRRGSFFFYLRFIICCKLLLQVHLNHLLQSFSFTSDSVRKLTGDMSLHFREGNSSPAFWHKSGSTCRRLYVCTVFLVPRKP